MSQFTLLDIIPCDNTLGEGVQWNHRDQSVWWTDIQSKKIFRYRPADKHLQSWSTPERVGCFAFAKNDERLVLALASGFAWFDLDSGRYEWLARPEADVSGNRANDGRVDRQGRFWMGTIVENAAHPEQSAGLYCLDLQGRESKHLTGLRISNSLCWSPDSRKLYHADSPSFGIDSYDFDAARGTLSNPQRFVQLPDGIEPDGSCVDAEGYVWNAQWGASRVVRYSPAGEMERELPLPVRQPTCVALGGPRMNWLFITTAKAGLSAEQLAQQPHAGALFIYQTDVTGIYENWYGACGPT